MFIVAGRFHQMRNKFGIILLCFFTLSGCGTFRRVALKTASPLLMDAMSGIEGEGNWEAFRAGTPANLTLIDGLLAAAPDDESLLVAAVKGNAGYAFGVLETLYLDDKLQDIENSEYKEQAIFHYTKAFDYGLKYLQENDLSLEDLKMALKEKKGLPGLLENQLPGDELSLNAVVYTAQALGSMINLQRENIQLVSFLPLVKGMFDWACEADPNIGFGVCQIFYGSYEAGRPAMLGGNPQKGKKIFEDFIKNHPHNWLGRVAFIEYFAIPQYDEDVYRSQKKELQKFSYWMKENLKWSPAPHQHEEVFSNPRLRLYQAIAIKRFKIIKKYEKDLF